MATTIDADTIRAYTQAHYVVHGDLPTTLRIGLASSELLRLYKRFSVGSCAFITACNPLGRLLDDANNIERNAALVCQLRAQNFTFLKGIGQDPSGEWPGEASFLVLGSSLETAKAIGVRHQQNALIWCGADTVPRLVLLR